MEFAIEDERIWLVQTRPITTLRDGSEESGTFLVSGLGAAPGIAVGRARVLESPDDGPQLEAGEVLVARMTNPDWVPTIRRASALVTDGGGMTCHAAIVARELGVPCVVGTRQATKVLRTGELITVDGRRGKVFEGDQKDKLAGVPAIVSASVSEPAVEPISTLLYVNLAVASHATEVADLPVDGVGLLRAEFMITEALGGTHPAQIAGGGSPR